MNKAIGKLREALKGVELLGVEAVELQPGSVVLVVLRPKRTASDDDIKYAMKTWASVAEFLQAEGVRAIACVIPPDFDTQVILVEEAK